MSGLISLVCCAVQPLRAQARMAERPLTLRALLDSVRETHPRILAAQARVRALEGSSATAGRLANPVLQFQMDGASFPNAAAVSGVDRESMTTAMLPLTSLYARGPRVAQATASVRAARADYDGERQRTGLLAAHAFYRVALAQLSVATNRDVAAWLDSVVAYNSSRVKEGVTAEADLLRSRLERDRASAEIAMAKAELAQAKAELNGFLGHVHLETAVTVGDAPLALPTSGDSISLARPDVLAARERVTAAQAAVGLERRLVIRDLGVMLGSKSTVGTRSMIAGFSIPIPLFDQNAGEIARAGAERDVAGFQLAEQERMAVHEVAGAEEAAGLLTAQAMTLSADNYLARADEVRRIALGAYREGAVSLLQVLDAARAWGDARLTYYRTLYAQHESVLTLIVARGADIYSTPLTPTGIR